MPRSRLSIDKADLNCLNTVLVLPWTLLMFRPMWEKGGKVIAASVYSHMARTVFSTATGDRCLAWLNMKRLSAVTWGMTAGIAGIAIGGGMSRTVRLGVLPRNGEASTASE